MEVFQESPDCAAVDLALNRKVQGGGPCNTSGFPSGGHAHRYWRVTPGVYIIGSRTRQLANTSGWGDYSAEAERPKYW